MNEIKDLMMWLSAPAGIAAVTAIWRAYVNIRDEAQVRKKATHAEHEVMEGKLAAMQTSLDTMLTAMLAAQEEAKALRADNEAKDKRIIALEADVSNALALAK